MHGDPKFHCSVCSRSFRQKHNLNEHVKRIHKKSGDYECPECTTTFVSPYERDRHLRMHSRKEGFECTICHVKLAKEGQRKQHMRLHRNAGTSKIKR
ncbi:zinc finger protein, partial [Aphelenchoides avenae]